jgi:hypothetical protein
LSEFNRIETVAGTGHEDNPRGRRGRAAASSANAESAASVPCLTWRRISG